MKRNGMKYSTEVWRVFFFFFEFSKNLRPRKLKKKIWKNVSFLNVIIRKRKWNAKIKTLHTFVEHTFPLRLMWILILKVKLCARWSIYRGPLFFDFFLWTTYFICGKREKSTRQLPQFFFQFCMCPRIFITIELLTRKKHFWEYASLNLLWNQ